MIDNLNPFRVIQISGEEGTAAYRLHPVVLSLAFGALGVGTAFLVTAIEGTLGSVSDFRPVADVQRIAGTSTTPAPPEFPLLRDTATWALATIIFLTIGVVWRQWQLLGSCLRELAANRVLIEKAQPDINRVRRLLGYKRMANYKGRHGIEGFIARMNHYLEVAGSFPALFLVFSLAVALTVILVSSYDSLGVFRLWNIDESSWSDGRFADLAYQNWWASRENLGGHVVYIMIAFVGIFAILLQNVVGLIAVYVIGGFPAFCDFGVDWFDCDGNFGWRPLGQVFRTVRWSLLMHGLALTILFAMVGAGVWPYAVLLLALWACVFPVYLGIPSLVMRSVGSDAKRAALIRAASDGPDDIERASSVVPYIRHASVKPLRMSRFGVYAFFASILLPTILTIIQIVGSSG